MSFRGKVWVFGVLPALTAFWAVIIWIVVTHGGRMEVVR